MTTTKLAGSDPAEPYLPDLALAEVALADIVRDYILDALRRGVIDGASEIDITPSFDVINPQSTQFLREYTSLLSNRVNRTLVEAIRQALHEGLQNGETYRQITDRVLEATGCIRNDAGKIEAAKGARYRAERIARTEISRAENAGREAQLRQAGAVRKIWRANPGACEFCVALDGTTIAIDQAFFRRGDVFELGGETGGRLRLDYCDTPHPPLHPHCRCQTEYHFDEQ